MSFRTVLVFLLLSCLSESHASGHPPSDHRASVDAQAKGGSALLRADLPVECAEIARNRSKTSVANGLDSSNLSALRTPSKKRVDFSSRTKRSDTGGSSLGNPWVPGFYAIYVRRNDTAEMLLKVDKEVAGFEEGDNVTSLHVAASVGNRTLMTILVDSGADIEARTKFGLTPLHVSAKTGPLEAVEYLAGSGAEIDARDSNNSTPLHYAVKSGQTQTVKYLLTMGAGIAARDRNDWTPLHYAASKGDLDIVKLLLEKGAEIDVRDNNGETPLYKAAERGHSGIVELLVEGGADIEVETNNGETPLEMALGKGLSEVVGILIRSKVNIDVRDNLNRTSFIEWELS